LGYVDPARWRNSERILAAIGQVRTSALPLAPSIDTNRFLQRCDTRLTLAPLQGRRVLIIVVAVRHDALVTRGMAARYEGVGTHDGSATAS